jgi:hypothetical protein
MKRPSARALLQRRAASAGSALSATPRTVLHRTKSRVCMMRQRMVANLCSPSRSSAIEPRLCRSTNQRWLIRVSYARIGRMSFFAASCYRCVEQPHRERCENRGQEPPKSALSLSSLFRLHPSNLIHDFVNRILLDHFFVNFTMNTELRQRE